MCGRFALGIPHDEIQQMHGYNVQVGEWVGRDQFVPRFNIAPRSQAPVMLRRDALHGGTAGGSGSSPSQPGPSTEASASNEARTDTKEHRPTEGEKEPPLPLMMQTMRWGLVPHFSKHEDPTLKTINARCEALIEEPRGMWASIKGKKRCAIVCQGYYEWMKKGKERLPYLTKPKEDRLMLLAGLWDRVVLEGSTEPLWTFTIVTTDASKDMSWLHDRQPVVLPDEQALSVWLDTSPGKWTPELTKLCAPYSSSEHPLTCYQVPKEVGKTGTESPSFILPIADRNDGIQAMFAKQTRKRRHSPTEQEQTAKKPKADETTTSEDNSDIEYIDQPTKGTERAKATTSVPKQSSAMGAAAHSGTPSKSLKGSDKPAKVPSPRKPKASQQSHSSAKITSFFTKK